MTYRSFARSPNGDCSVGVPSTETPDCAERLADPLAEVRRVVAALESGDYAARGTLTDDEAVDVTIRVLNEFARKLEYRESFTLRRVGY